MVKLMVKKSAIAPSAAHSLEEWHVQALQRYGTASHTKALLLTPHHAALRIQLRYRVYKEKVRSILKKTANRVKDDSANNNQNDSTGMVGSVKHAVRERGVKGSSMALAVAYTARKPAGQNAADAQQPRLSKNVAKANGGYAGVGDLRAPIQEAPTTWGTQEWVVPAHGFLTETLFESDDENNETCSLPDDELVKINAATHGNATTSIAWVDDTKLTEDEDSSALDRRLKFVDVMHPSWLLSSMEERCAEAAASLGARTHQQGHTSELSVLNIRHTVLDLLFILRSGHPANFHGREASPVAVHHRNLVRRLSSTSETETLDDEVRRRVRRIFDSLKSDMVMPAVRCLGWMLTKTWRKLFSGLHVDVESLQRMREVIEAAGNVSVVFTPTHESHLDYLIVSYLCFAYGIPLPRIAAGNNLDLPVIGSFLRANGSFFIRRSFRNDPLYKQVLQHYVDELLSDGNPIEVFIEGGRSRNGRVCKPKMGFLTMFHEYAQQQANRGKDVLLVPISLDYDRVFEVEEYANQLLGKPKQKESLKVFFESLWDLFFLRCGHCYVRFGEPVSIKARPSITDTAHELAVRMQTCGTITSTAIVSALLMWKREYTTRDMLVARAHWLVGELEHLGTTIAHLESVEELVSHALSILHVEVQANGVIQSKVEFPTRALELGFYRNHLVHVFLPDMAVLGAIDALRLRHLACGGSAAKIELATEDVLAMASWIWRFLRHICRHGDVDLRHHLAALELRVPALTLSSTMLHVDASGWRVARMVNFTLALHWSFVDSLLVATLAAQRFLFSVVVVAPVPEKQMLHLAQLMARELFMARAITHAEAFCSESIKQAFELLREMDILRFTPCAETGLRLYTAHESLTSEDAGFALLQRVHALGKPVTSLYREDKPPTELTRDDVRALVKRAVAEADAAHSGGSRARVGVYATWMSH